MFPIQRNSEKVHNHFALLHHLSLKATTGLPQAAAETKSLCSLWFAGQSCHGWFPEMTRCMVFEGRLAQCQGRGCGREGKRLEEWRHRGRGGE